MKILKNNSISNFIYIFLLIFICYVFLPLKSFANENSQVQQVIKIEENIWGFQYKKDNILKRLDRIEKDIFGEIKTSSSVNNRIKAINEALGLESYEDSQKQAYELNNMEITGINYPQIDSLEEQIFKQTYKKENIYSRLDRLENKIFGSVQKGDLSTRTEKLKTYLKPQAIAKDPTYYTEQVYQTTPDIETYMNSQKKFDDSDVYIQLSGLETILFSKTFSQDPVELRLNRLERKIFQRDFSSDDEYLRLQRLQAAANAQKTAQYYEANKIQKYASTGLQFGSIILMILALIL